MKKLKLFFACLLMAVLSIGQVWATDFTLSSAAEVTKDGITVTFAQGDGSNPPAWYAAGLRLYVKNTVTITSTSNITAISFNWEKQGSKTFNTSCTASTGSYTHPSSAGVGTWTGSATSVTFTLGNVSGAQLQLNTFSVTTEGGGSSDPSLTVEPATIDFGTVDQNAVVASKTVAVTFANLTGSVTYSGLSGAFSASGSINATGDEITIAANTATIGEYSQTLTVQSAADSKSAEVTVKMNVVEPFDGLKLTFDFVTHPEGWPAAKASAVAGNYVYTISATDYTFAHSKVGDGIYCGGTSGSSGYLMIAKSNSLGLPAISGYKLVKVEGTLNNSGTPSTKAEITITNGTDEVTGGGSQTWDEKGVAKTYNLSGTVANTMYYLNVSGTANLQMITLVLYYEEAEAPTVAAPTISGVTPFLSSTEVTLTQNDADAIYYTTDEAKKENPSVDTWTEYNSASKPSFNATTTIYAAAIKGSAWSAVAEKTFTKITPLTVAQALVEATGSGKYVTGTITSITEVNVGYKNATYVISDVTAGVPANEMIIYRGKYLDGADFTSEDQIHVGDVVVVSGTIGVYQEKNQLAQGNQIESITPAAVVAPVFSPDGGGFMGETDVTISCATASSAIYYTLDGSAPSKLSTLYESAIHLNATTTINAIAFVGDDASLVISRTFTLSEPMTVADAFDALDSEDPINNAAVAGIVFKVDACAGNTYATYWISDDGTNAEKKLEIYHGYGLNGANFAANGIQEGDEVTVFGNLTIYKDNQDAEICREFASGSRLLAFNRPQVDVESISLTESTAEVEEGKTVTLHASVVPANATNKTIVWSVQSGDTYASVDQNGVVTGIAAGEAVIRAASVADGTKYAECTVTVTEPAPLSPWASVYTSNVTLSTEGGTSASAAKVKFYGEEGDGYDAIKAGTGSAQGAVVVNIPAGATALHFHAYSWYNETVELTVTAPTGVTVTPSEAIDINKNSGISGSSSTYTLAEGSDPKTDAYYAVSLSGNTEPVALTISATSGKRFVLFGVNQEGGLVLESIAVSGTASVLEYNDGDHFDPTGLVVTGHYSDDSEATISEGIDWTFDPDPLTEGTTSISVTATVSEITSAAFPVNGLTVNGAAPLSPWASVYTSNVTLSTEGGTSASAAKVKFYGEEGDGYDAIKAGTGSAQGAVVVNVPAGATALHFHAYSWYNETVELTVTAPTGVTVTPSEAIAINKNSGISGSSSTYTLAEGSDPKTDAYYAVSLSGNTEPVALTISATSGKRFVLFGVNQEGGVLPVLQSLAISGDLENKTYEAGQSLNMTGLTVMGTYTLGGTPQTPVDVTDQVEEWLYDALQAGDESVTISAKIGTVTSAGYEISGLTVTDPTPTITASPSFWNFNSVEQGAPVAAKAITVTLKNVAAATVAISGDGASAYSVDETALTASGTITITPSTATIGNFNATVTISDNAGVAPSATITLLMTVNAVETPVSTTSEWVAATAIEDGMEVLITGVKNEDVCAMGEQKNNNRTAVAGTLSEGVFTPGEKTMSFTLVATGETDTYYIKASNDKYLYNASTSGNSYLRAKADNEDASWTITLDGDGNAVITSVENTNRTLMRFNLNGTSTPLFNCYASGQQSVKLYVPKPVTPPTPVYETVRSGLEINRYYTVCLPKKVTAIKGATFWKLEKKSEDGSQAYLEEETNNLPFAAGKPFIIQATADKLEVVYEGEPTETAGVNGAIHGTLTYMDADALTAAGSNVYMLYNNELRPVGENNHLDANRAYVKVDELDPVSSVPQGAPGKRVIAMPMQKDEAQGFDNLESGDTPKKVMVDGTLYILRGEKVFDATGRLVK